MNKAVIYTIVIYFNIFKNRIIITIGNEGDKWGDKKDEYYRLRYVEWMWANEGVSFGTGWFNDTRHNREKKNQLQLPYMGIKITIIRADFDRLW